MSLIDGLMPIEPASKSTAAQRYLRLSGLLSVLLFAGSLLAGQSAGLKPGAQIRKLPTRRALTQQFLNRRGWLPGAAGDRRFQALSPEAVVPLLQGSTAATWTPLGPSAVVTPQYGLVSGRVSAIALDPADATGNHVYIGTTGGGVWMAQNAAADPAQVVLQPLTDNLSALSGAWDASISIGAITVQPGGTGVILAGTGDPNDALDSYYGAGILRSADGGSTWSLIPRTSDLASGLAGQDFSFTGEGFAGFAWSTVNPQIVVAAVSQAYEGTLVNAVRPSYSMQGLYYSNDSGLTWHLATITDGSGTNVQGPLNAFPLPDGNAATAVVWNPVRKLFFAAVRYHGYYQSPDGVTWTRLAAQPGSGLSKAMCPTKPGTTGSIACPIFRGTLAVNPVTGDTFAWTVDLNNQDQGLWQDLCAMSGGVCTNSSVAFQQSWSTTALESSTSQGSATIADGVYSLALAAVPVPQQQMTKVFAGADDLWEATCPVSQGCSWRNTTNATTCASAKVGPFQHAISWNAANANEILIGNDSGLWRSLDGVAESGSVCSANDASHFQNLNGDFQNKDGIPGSIAETESLPPFIDSPFNLMAGLGVNGVAGVKGSGVTAQWPQMLGGFGGQVAIDSTDISKWYVNDQPGVAIYRCSQQSACSPSDFGSAPVIGEPDVDGDGYSMPQPAPFLLDPLDASQFIVGTCRVWRGATNGAWKSNDTLSPILDTGKSSGACEGDALIRSVAAAALSPTSEVIYVGMRGSLTGGGRLAGHVLSATLDLSANQMPMWKDLTLHTVTNDSRTLNYYGLDVSSVVIDPGNPSNVYVTVEGQQGGTLNVQRVYRSTDAGGTWTAITANLPNSPVSALVIDPNDHGVVYVATDQGVYSTTSVSTCGNVASKCWSAYGSGIPQAPVVALTATMGSGSSQALVAATYGRGIWQTPLSTAGTTYGSASVNPGALTFAGQEYGTTSPGQTVTVLNTGSIAVTVSSISLSGNSEDFAAYGCSGQTLSAGSSCTIDVTFSPQATGSRAAQLAISVNASGGQLTVDLSGTGLTGESVSLTPASLNFGLVQISTTSGKLPAQLTNLSALPVSISSVAVSAPFVLSSNSCGSSLASNSSCQVTISFVPTQAGSANGVLTFSSSAGVETVQLTGIGGASPTDVASPVSVSFPVTAVGQVSVVQSVNLVNNGDLPLHVASITASTNYQQSNNCISGVAAHASCAIAVSFAPTQSGTLTGVLTITDDLGVRAVALSGTAILPGALSANPASLTFSPQQPSVTSAPQTVTITNTGAAAIANIGFQFIGRAAASYAVSGTSCGASLGGGMQCAVNITFTPPSVGSISATLAISSSTAGVTAAQVQLNGSGLLSGGVSVLPSILTFVNPVGVGQSSAAQVVTLTNSSAFAIDSVSVATSAPFSISTNTCVGQLGPGASCTAGVVFQPNAAGRVTGSLTMSASALATPISVPLDGTGFEFSVQPSGASSLTVSNGQQADYRLLISPAGAGGTFSLQCGTLPANAVCLFSPPSMTLSAGVQGNVEVQIYTGSSATARTEEKTPMHGWPIAFALLLLPLTLRRGGRLFLVLLLAIVVSSGLTSCAGAIGGTTTAAGSPGSGGSTGQGSSSGTPAGTYSIPVTVSSMGISHSVTLKLTVD